MTNSNDIIKFCDSQGVCPDFIADIEGKQLDFAQRYQSTAS